MHTFKFFSQTDLMNAARFIGLRTYCDYSIADCELFVEGDLYHDMLSRDLDRQQVKYELV